MPGSSYLMVRITLHVLYGGTSHSEQVMQGLMHHKPGDDEKFAIRNRSHWNPSPEDLNIWYRAGGSNMRLANKECIEFKLTLPVFRLVFIFINFLMRKMSGSINAPL
jgi:hypothetical protein